MERLSHQVALDREAADQAFTAAANMREQQQNEAADLAKREAAVESRAAGLAGTQAQLAAAQAAALQQLEKLETSMNKNLVAHEKQVTARHSHSTHWLEYALVSNGNMVLA